MSLDVLVPLAWTCWAILFGAVLVGTVWMARDAQPTPEVGPGFGCLVIAVLYILVIGAGGILYTFTKSQSQGGVFTMAVLLGFVVIMLIAQPSIMAYKQWSFERGYARVGEFREPALRPLAEAIRIGDSATLRQLLGGKSPPSGRDRAGHDLLGYSDEPKHNFVLGRPDEQATGRLVVIQSQACEKGTRRAGDGPSAHGPASPSFVRYPAIYSPSQLHPAPRWHQQREKTSPPAENQPHASRC